MATTRKVLLNYNLNREICTAAVNSAKNGSSRAVTVMKKLLKGDSGKRKWYESKQRPMAGPLETPKLISNHVSRRRVVLNKLFMQHITDLMATGEASTHFLGRSIEITHVNVTPDFCTVLVYWGSKRDTEHHETEKLLNDCAYGLRHELTQLRVIGQVPIIKFVKNKQIASLVELEKRMYLADYGDDYEPVIQQPVRKPELTLNAKLPPEVREKILELENEIVEETDDDFHVDIPPMRHDVLGVDHHAIMTRVTMSLKKSQDAARNRLLNEPPPLPTEPGISSAVQAFLCAKEDTEAFTDFLQMRQRDERRKARLENKQRVLAYNNPIIDSRPEDDNDFFSAHPEDNDIDGFEDIKLDSLK